jgi:hypothetical protein
MLRGLVSNYFHLPEPFGLTTELRQGRVGQTAALPSISMERLFILRPAYRFARASTVLPGLKDSAVCARNLLHLNANVRELDDAETTWLRPRK